MNASLWRDECPDLASSTEELPARCEVLVVGAGLAGLSVAGRLRELGVDVRIVDRDGPGAGASAANGGFVLIGHASAYPAMRRRLGVDTARGLLALARETHARWRTLGAEVDHETAGSLTAAGKGDTDEARLLEEACTLLGEDGVECRLEGPPAALAHFGPSLRIVEDGGLHPGRLVRALAGRAPPVIRAEVEAIDGDTARVVGGGEVRFGAAVVATNAWAARLWPSLPITPARGQVLATEPVLPRRLPEVVYAHHGYDYVRQRADGRLVFGGLRHRFRDAEATDDDRPTEEVQAALDAWIARHVPFAKGARVTHRWAGIMGFSPDELPLVGELDARTWVIAGFTGHGLGLTGALGRLLADAVRGDAERRLAPFRPDRF